MNEPTNSFIERKVSNASNYVPFCFAQKFAAETVRAKQMSKWSTTCGRIRCYIFGCEEKCSTLCWQCDIKFSSKTPAHRSIKEISYTDLVNAHACRISVTIKHKLLFTPNFCWLLTRPILISPKLLTAHFDFQEWKSLGSFQKRSGRTRRHPDGGIATDSAGEIRVFPTLPGGPHHRKGK